MNEVKSMLNKLGATVVTFSPKNKFDYLITTISNLKSLQEKMKKEKDKYPVLPDPQNILSQILGWFVL